MPQIQKLKQNIDFRRTYGRGKSFSEPALVTYVLKNNRAGICRFGVTTGKKIGNAVMRNRCRRIITAAFKEISGDICCGCDIVFVARFKTTKLKSTDVCEIMKRQLKSAGVLK
ncbi:MAG: ribonuclease P protein component [Clostridia bacterium]|nr:ribonuclease P protein component [Clostridia bacterium]